MAARRCPPLQVLGVWHDVAPGDTVEKVCARYGADPETVAELNDIPLTGAISGRDEIFIPKKGGSPPGTGAAPPAPVTAQGKAGAAPAPTSGPVEGHCGEEGRPCFAWPAEGKLSSLFGKRGSGHHDGIDIVAPKGTEVVAAADGAVIYAGDQIKGYGNLVLVKHEGGVITVYAHNDRILVKEGAKIKRGEKIAEIGDTGSATTCHLHFEVRVGEAPVDPMLYLPTKEK